MLDSKFVSKLLQRVALDHPDRYAATVKALGDIGRKAAYYQGESMGIDDLRDPIATSDILRLMDKELDGVTDKDPDERRRKTEDIWLRYASRIERDSMQAAKAKGNAVADSVVSGARGKPLQLRAMLSTPAIFEDSLGRIVPIFARSSYASGVSPAEMLAGTYGARKSVTATKTATAKGGFWSKMIGQAAADLVVTEDDCGTTNGIDMDPADRSVRHRVLAKPAGGVDAGDIISRKGWAALQNKAKGPVIVRSAITCESRHGICAKCAGAGPEGKLPSIGEHVGVTAAQSLGEPVCLHGSTLVRMADGSIKPITDIVPGDMVLGSDMQGRLTPTRVVNTFVNGYRHCYKTVVRKGFGADSEQIELISTLEHKVLSSNKSRKLAPTPEILPIKMSKAKDNRHVVFMPAGCCGLGGREEPLALMLGLMTGDGCYTGGLTSKGVSFSCYDPELEAYVRAYLAPHRLRLARQGRGEFRVSAFDQHREFKVVDGVCVRNKLKHLLTSEGMWGQSSGNKTAPASIWEWDNASVAAYIGGLIATDGWVTRSKLGGVVGIASNSKQLLEAVKEQMEVRFGLYSCRISPKRKKRPDGTFYAPTYELVYCGKDNIEAIQQLIPVPGCKQASLDSLAAELPVGNKKKGRFAVLSQTYVGYEMTYDIEVDNATHLFALANGLIVSNTQSSLNTKHLSGAATAKKQYAGLEWLARFVQVPDNFPDRAPLADEEGLVTLEKAPQGGHYVHVGKSKHYVPQHLGLLVQNGQHVERGEQLSDGIVRPDDVVRLRGLGEGRLYYARRLKQMLDEGGTPADTRQAEIVARATVNHVRLNSADDFKGYLPDDPVRYGDVLDQWEEAADSADIPVERATGMYLQRPALHYSIGTQLTPKMAERLKSTGFKDVRVSKTAPPFDSEMLRLQTQAYANTDWLASQHTSYLGRQLSDAAMRGQDTKLRGNTHFAPPLAYGVDFGKKLKDFGVF